MKYFRMRRALAIAKKEKMHILRDPFTMIVAIAIPVFLTVMFGFAINLLIKDVRLAVFDADLSQSSRELYQKFIHSKYFVINEISPLILDPTEPIAKEHSKVVLVIPHKYEENLFHFGTSAAQVFFDGADSATIGVIRGYVQGVNLAANKDFMDEYEIPYRPWTIALTPRYLFNPEQNSQWFIVPGLSTVILAILSILLTALTIAREWETGSMELLLSTPARPAEIIFGKLLPYVVLGIIALLLVYTAARVVFHIPFRGSYLAYFGGSLLFIANYLSMGLFISIATKNQQIAMQTSLMVGYMPSILLSGFIFSIDNMTPFWQGLTALLPARWYMTICRACYLKGATLMDLLVPFSVLFVTGVILFVAATKKFKGTLES